MPFGSVDLDVSGLNVVTLFEDPDYTAFVFSSLLTISGTGLAFREYGWMISTRLPAMPSGLGSPKKSVFQMLYRQTPQTRTGVPFPNESVMAKVQVCVMKSQNDKMRTCFTHLQNAMMSTFSEGESL